uniref:Uncharacterized protein n=1 Tax=viral metagenome TaxID=1070528 RepID=A0A6C0C3W1_9ZZZZ
MKKKQQLGQFYTTNYKYILQNLFIPKHIVNIIEPFAGNCDLLKFENIKKRTVIEKYDIDPKLPDIIKKDTLLDPPSYKNKFVITNPPYLARNKCADKSLFDKYKINDLYKCFILQLINDPPLGGIIIIPLNFWCSIRKSDAQLRKEFLNVFNIIKLNIFEEKVFIDTSYTVCSFQFEKIYDNKVDSINTNIYPIKKNLIFNLNDKNNYIIGGDIYLLKQNPNIKVERLTSKNQISNTPFITNLLLKCIDDNLNSKISLSLVKDENIFIDNTPNCTARSYATLIIKPRLSMEQQRLLSERFNIYMTFKRKFYHSLFLTNYRESNSIARKRISFNLAYKIINNLISKL